MTKNDFQNQVKMIVESNTNGLIKEHTQDTCSHIRVYYNTKDVLKTTSFEICYNNNITKKMVYMKSVSVKKINLTPKNAERIATAIIKMVEGR